ncbi:MAG: hypothetical protein AB7O59_22190 [Pirellulales bacterium]
MRGIPFSQQLLIALAMSGFVVTPAVRAVADELPAPAARQEPELLATPPALEDVALTLIDEKLALSLAVETHVQIELTQYALACVHDEGLKQLTQSKLDGYRRLFHTVDALTEGRARAMLVSPAADVASQTDAPRSADAEKPRAKSRKRAGGGLSNVLQNATAKAVLRVRLEIAQQYSALLRSELELSPPGEFDRRYAGMELFGQLQWLAMLRVFEAQASPDFGKLVHLATAASEHHLLESRQVAERLHGTSPLQDVSPRVADSASATGTK